MVFSDLLTTLMQLSLTSSPFNVHCKTAIRHINQMHSPVGAKDFAAERKVSGRVP
jgi:hypothetical protein